MHRWNRNVWLTAVFSSLVLSWGCTFSTVGQVGTFERPQEQFKALAIGKFIGDKLSPEMERKFAGKIRGHLMEKEGFDLVTTEGEVGLAITPVVILSGTITDFDEGSSGLRWFIGFGAGQSRFGGVFEIRDAQGKVLTKFTSSRSYAGGLGIGGVSFLSMEDLVDRVAGDVAETVIKWRKGEPIPAATE